MKETKDYVLACAKAQGQLAKLLLNYGEGDSRYRTYHELIKEIELLKECFMVEDIYLWNKVKSLKHGGKKNLGSCYTSPFGWGGSPRGGWGGTVGGGVYVACDDGTDIVPLPFGKPRLKKMGNFFEEEKKEGKVVKSNVIFKKK